MKGALAAACAVALAWSVPAAAVYQCGDQKDDCQCGGNNPYPCCSNGSNCTWWAWEAACCNWKTALPGWGNANTWGSYASKNGNFVVQSEPVAGCIATSTKGGYGHVAWVESVEGNKIHVSEMNCCGSCNYGMRKWTYDKSYFNAYVIKKGLPPPGPVCPNGKCEGGENCANCPNDCGACCGNGKCDNGENCASCAKDCGACCGNGQCDNGETCATCSKDCVCLPQGQLDQATCTQVSGWALDPDTPKPVPVKLQEGEQVLASGTADLAHPKHPGHGFLWMTPAELKNGTPHSVTVKALDDLHPQLATFGPSAFVCSSGKVPSGEWQSEQVVHSGLQVAIPQAEGWTIRHSHPANDAYPLAGAVKSCLKPLFGAFDEGYATMAFSFGAQPWVAEAFLDGVSLGQFLATGDQRLEFGTGTVICLQTTALKEIAVPVDAHAQFGPVHVRKGPWWFTATPTSTGWRANLRQPDGIDVRGEGTLQGAVRAEHNLLEPFDQIEWTSQPEELPDGVHAKIRVGITEIDADQPGHHVITGLWGQEMTVQIGADAPLAAPAKMRAQVFELRVHQTGFREQGPWRVEQANSYGLSADVTPQAAATDGMQVELQHHPPAWWSTGKVRAATTVTLAPIDRVRATVTANQKLLHDQGLVAELQVGRKTVWTSDELPAGQTGPLPIDVVIADPPANSEVAWLLGLQEDRWDAAAAAVMVRASRWRAGGWWTYPSADMQGWVDLRPTGGARIEARKPIVGGQLRIDRALPWPAKAVKLRYRQDLRPIEARARLLFDGDLVREFGEVGDAFKDYQFDGPVQTISLVVATQADEVALAEVATADTGKTLRFAEITAVQVQGPDGKWVLVDQLPDETVATVGADAGGADAKAAAVPKANPAGFCSSMRHCTAAWPWLAAFFGAWAALAARRRYS